MLLLLTVLPAPVGVLAATNCEVTTLADSGGGSLRHCLLVLDTGGTITFQTGLTGMITLASDLPALSKVVAVAGPGASLLTVNRNDRVGVIFTVSNGGVLTASGLTLSGANYAVWAPQNPTVESNASVALTDVVLSGNGTGVRVEYTTSATLTNCTLTGNDYGVDAYGGRALATLTDVTIRGSFIGVNLYFGGSATLTNVTLAHNTSGVFFMEQGSRATVTNSTFDGNRYGIHSNDFGGDAMVTDSVFAANTYGVYIDEFGGRGGSATLTNVTISGSLIGIVALAGSATLAHTTLGGNDIGVAVAYPGSASVANSILADSTSANCSLTGGSISNGGYNLDDGSSCGFGSADGSLSGVSAELASLTSLDHGGATATIALLPSSPAVNQIPLGGTNCPATDQRGVARPQGTGCDSGAFELTLGPVLTLGIRGGGTVSRSPDGGTAGTGAGSFLYPPNTVVTLTPEESDGQDFTGWIVDGVARGWAASLTLTIDAPHIVQATFANSMSFTDVPTTRDDYPAIAALAARGSIKGYGDGTLGPDDGVLRAQIAALIARVMPSFLPAAVFGCVLLGGSVPSWDCESWSDQTFTDQWSAGEHLGRDVGTLAHYGVAQGYGDGRFGPNEPVTYAQTIALITRAMLARGYWVEQPNEPLPPTMLATVPIEHLADLRTFAHYTQQLGGVPASEFGPPTEWEAPHWNSQAPRGWCAMALWAALDTHWGVTQTP
jgi:hypothetical protein